MTKSKSRTLGYTVARELSDIEVEVVSGGLKQGECVDKGQETTWCNGTNSTYQDDCK